MFHFAIICNGVKMTAKLRSVLCVGMQDLLTREEVETFTQVADVSFGDSAYTLLSYRDFADWLELVCTATRRVEVADEFFAACGEVPPHLVYVDLER
jgi:hypothetical protein